MKYQNYLTNRMKTYLKKDLLQKYDETNSSNL